MVIVIAAIILAIAVVTGIIAILMVWKKIKEGTLQEPNYRVFFIIGISWVPFSIVLMLVSFVLQIPFYIGFPLFALGLVYLIVGLKNRDKWKKKE